MIDLYPCRYCGSRDKFHAVDCPLVAFGAERYAAALAEAAKLVEESAGINSAPFADAIRALAAGSGTR